METRKVTDIIYRQDLYPRIKADPVKIQEYAENLEVLPPVEINQRNELIDGYHRWTAHRERKVEDINVFITETTSDAQLLELAISRNATHGYQLSKEDKKKFSRKLYQSDKQVYSKELLTKLFSVSYSVLNSWMSDIDKAEREERRRIIREMYLACYTEEEIAELANVSRQTVNIEVSQLFADLQKLAKVNFFDEDWQPPIYNVWTFSKKTNEVSHFGNSEQRILDNLLYLYTVPLDIVIDPFAGGGSTIDVCKNRMRRYWISDRKPTVLREGEIRQLDICQELPPLNKRWSEVTLTFLDPPYWKQAEGEYSDDPEDLANMSLEQFTEQLSGVVRRITEKQSRGAIAMLMQPTQWRAPERHYTDHVFQLIEKIGNKRLQVENRISVPYNTEQYNAQQVDWAKENKQLLVISRELIVWRIN